MPRKKHDLGPTISCEKCGKTITTYTYNKFHGSKCTQLKRIPPITEEQLKQYKVQHDALIESFAEYFNSHIDFLDNPNHERMIKLATHTLNLLRVIKLMKTNNIELRSKLKDTKREFVKYNAKIKADKKLRKQNGNNDNSTTDSI